MKKLYFYLMAMVVFPSPAFSYELQEVLTRLEAKEKQIDKLSFVFQQEIKFKDFDTASEVTGTVDIGPSNQIRIQKSDPQEQITISNGRDVWIYTPAYRQVWVGRWGEWNKGEILSKGMIPLDNYVASLKKGFDLTMLNETSFSPQKGIWIKAVPKKKKSGYYLSIMVSTETWLPVETRFMSDSSQVVTRLSDFNIDPDLSEQTFHFDPPPDTEIIPLN